MPGVTFLPLGAIVQTFTVAAGSGGDDSGSERNIVLGFPSQDLYEKHNAPYFGETVGRVANRISGARIDDLNGRSYDLPRNNGPNSLHGGVRGFGKRVFQGPERVTRDGRNALLFKHVSADGEEGYPGGLELRVWYIVGTEREGNVESTILEIEYEAELVGDNEEVRETVVAVTNHSYFNLAGTPSIAGTVVKLATNQYQEVDSTGIPTGKIASFPGIDADKEFVLGEAEPDVDHCFVLNTEPASVPLDTRPLPLRTLASFREREGGQDGRTHHLEVRSTEPAFQFYTGKYIDVPALPDANLPARGPRSGFCVEPSRYINAVNVDDWKAMVLLRRGDVYGSRIVYKAWKV